MEIALKKDKSLEHARTSSQCSTSFGIGKVANIGEKFMEQTSSLGLLSLSSTWRTAQQKLFWVICILISSFLRPDC